MKFKITEPVGTSNGFWYDITDGGYIIPEEILSNQEDIDRINGAIDTLIVFKREMEKKELLNEF